MTNTALNTYLLPAMHIILTCYAVIIGGEVYCELFYAYYLFIYSSLQRVIGSHLQEGSFSSSSSRLRLRGSPSPLLVDAGGADRPRDGRRRESNPRPTAPRADGVPPAPPGLLWALGIELLYLQTHVLLTTLSVVRVNLSSVHNFQ